MSAARENVAGQPYRPSTVYLRASTPTDVSIGFGLKQPASESCSALMVSHHLSGFLRTEVVGLLHPTYGHGVYRVSSISQHPLPDEQASVPSKMGGGSTAAFPAIRPSPRRTPLHISCTASLRPIPPCRFDDSEVLFRSEVRTVVLSFPKEDGLSFLGLVSPSRSPYRFVLDTKQYR